MGVFCVSTACFAFVGFRLGVLCGFMVIFLPSWDCAWWWVRFFWAAGFGVLRMSCVLVVSSMFSLLWFCDGCGFLWRFDFVWSGVIHFW